MVWQVSSYNSSSYPYSNNLSSKVRDILLKANKTLFIYEKIISKSLAQGESKDNKYTGRVNLIINRQQRKSTH